MWELADKDIKSVTATIVHMLQKLSRDMEDKRKDPKFLEMATTPDFFPMEKNCFYF